MNKLQTILVLIAVAILIFLGLQYFNQKEEVAPAPVLEPKVVVDNVPSEALPDRFPANFPLEKGVPVTANYTAQAEGAFQSTRQFISEKTLAESYKIYTDYLKKDGWTTGATMDEETIKSIFATKGRASITITMSQNTATLENVVDISFVYR